MWKKAKKLKIFITTKVEINLME